MRAMVQKRGFDSPVGPSPAADPVAVRIAYEYVASATVWLLVGTLAGLIDALKLNWPDVLAVPWLSFGRVRAIHTNVVFWGWSTIALSGLSLYVVSRTSRAPLWRPGLSRIALWLWNGVTLGAVVTLAAGITRGPQEYRELALPLAAGLAAGVILNGLVIYRTLATRRVREIYVSNWYILGAYCFVTVIVIVGYLGGRYAVGLPNVVIQGYYMHTAVGMWFTQIALGLSYYAIPRLLGRPVYSYALGVLAFWTNLLFYPLIGAHHFLYSPVPWWVQTVAILFSAGMMVPVFAGGGNLLLTFRGTRDLVGRSYALPFLLAGIVAYVLVSMQGTLEAFRTANVYWHFTHFTVAHSHLSMYGFIAFVIWGTAYGLLPRLTGAEPNVLVVGVHFWLALVGYGIYVVSITIAGVLQGFAWVAGKPFIDSVVAAEPFWLWRTVGGLLMVVSHVCFAWNVWLMRPGRAAARVDRANPSLAAA